MVFIRRNVNYILLSNNQLAGEISNADEDNLTEANNICISRLRDVADHIQNPAVKSSTIELLHCFASLLKESTLHD